MKLHSKMDLTAHVFLSSYLCDDAIYSQKNLKINVGFHLASVKIVNSLFSWVFFPHLLKLRGGRTKSCQD